MAKPVIMPRFGMTQEEATIVKWLVKEGDRVEPDDPLAEVTTDKVNMEVPAPAEGTPRRDPLPGRCNRAGYAGNRIHSPRG